VKEKSIFIIQGSFGILRMV